MKSTTIVFALLIALWAALSCGPKSPTGSGEPGFAVHEWGVLVGCAVDTSGFVTSRPEYPSLVREPVIYVHMRDKRPISVRAIFNTGEPTATYPAAMISGDTVNWPVIDFAPWVRSDAGLDTSNFVPLEQIIDQLNDVDADMLYLGSKSARFLFYEGAVPNINTIEVTLLGDDTSVVLKNIGGYTVYDLAFSASDQFALGPSIPKTAMLDSLAVGQTDTIRIVGGVTAPFAEPLEALGFTTSEAEAFENLWLPSFYESGPAAEAAGSIIYRIPQTVYDDLITLVVDPQPDEIIRTLFVLNHIYQ